MIALRGGGGEGLRSKLQEKKKKNKGKIPKPENYERKNFNVLPVPKDLN